MSDLTLLDCTLRDGGYYNNWNFSSSFVSAYLDSCVASGIDVVELDFVFCHQLVSKDLMHLPPSHLFLVYLFRLDSNILL